jgi:hypothetical protein
LFSEASLEYYLICKLDKIIYDYSFIFILLWLDPNEAKIKACRLADPLRIRVLKKNKSVA